MAATSPLRPGVDAFHRERSRCVDAFANAEAVINRLLDSTGTKRGSEPLKQRIAILRAVKPTSGYSKLRKKSVDAALLELEGRLALRADIVHGFLQIAEFEDANRACFANARQESVLGQQMRAFTLGDLREVTLELNVIAARIASCSS